MTPSEIIRDAADRLAAAGDSRPWPARDPVNLPMIRNWLEAIGGAVDAVGVGCQDTAPPAMIQVWTMPGLHRSRGDDDPLAAMSALLEEAGYPSIVATNCDQVYHRPVRVGEQLAVQTRLVDVTGPKRTALGEGWFVTTRSTWTSSGEPVATMDFRVLRFRPEPRKPPRRDATPSAPPGVPASSGRSSRQTPSSSGPVPRRASCASSAATAAGRCAIRPARGARRAGT